MLKGVSPTRRVSVLAVPNGQVIDVTAPLEVFSRATRWIKEQGLQPHPAYEVEIIGISRGPFQVSSGLTLVADRAFGGNSRGIDTLLVAGGLGIREQLRNQPLLKWIQAASRVVRRLGSVCTGAFLLAEAGLLDGKRATTHWNSCSDLARRYPRIRVEPDPIFVREGNLYTSAGVTAGMDLALALVEEDHGPKVALAVARHLVLFLKRPGGQSQFSAQLSVQAAQREPLRELPSWMADHLSENLSVPTLAKKTAMSPRNFARAFAKEMGTTPAQFVRRLRVETACRLLLESRRGLKNIAAECGFQSAEVMRRAFHETFSVSPENYRERFQTSLKKAGGQ